MTLDELFTTLRDRAIRLFRRDASILVTPPGSLKEEEREYVRANLAAVLAALDAPKPPKAEVVATLTVDQILASDEDTLERRYSALFAPVKEVRWHTAHGWMPLSHLTPEQVRAFASAGHLSREEVVEWAKTRRSL